MPLQTYTIEMKATVDDEAHAALTEITRQFARNMLSTASLVNQGRTNAMVVARVADSFYDTRDIELLDDELTDNESL